MTSEQATEIMLDLYIKAGDEPERAQAIHAAKNRLQVVLCKLYEASKASEDFHAWRRINALKSHS